MCALAFTPPAPALRRRRPSVGSSWASPASMRSIPSPGSATPSAAASPAANYERVEANIGEGTYGKVHKARDLRTGRLVAIKKAKASQADREVGGIGFIALREIKLMRAVSHPNVMGCLDVFVDGGAVHLVMDFMDGDLKKVLDSPVTLSEAHVRCLSRQILEGLAALHRVWFVHRDVTPNNVLLNFSTGEAKLSDFGFARTIGHDDRPLTPMCTTLWYRAPELLYGARFYGQSVDMWSAGCIVGEMFTRQALFQGRGEFDMFWRVFEKRGTPTEEVWKDVSSLPSFVEFSYYPPVPMAQLVPSASPTAHDLLEGLLCLDPKKRLGAEDSLAHAFFGTDAACEPHQLPFVELPRRPP
eukprot:TRINITY_DN904_c3_g1_i1.p1 TRINITY_DN904_c3_g1~~TRINITY_DN904_c3_g1_i1.p1  ORF type:complete len:357 (+),score=61.40 TRINITY_DN904_c3_g1_i1:272-1342(+)